MTNSTYEGLLSIAAKAGTELGKIVVSPDGIPLQRLKRVGETKQSTLLVSHHIDIAISTMYKHGTRLLDLF